MSSIISIKNLNKSFGNKKILNNINFNIKSNDSVAIIGESGCGKSVFLKCIAGIYSSDAKTIIKIDNIDVSNHLFQQRHLKSRIGFLFQKSALFDSMTVGENIIFGDYSTKAKYGFLSKKDIQILEQNALDILNKVHLNSDIIHQYPDQLSGGMQRRVAIARVLASKPDILLLDEPTAGLDPFTSKNISELLKALSVNTTTVTITHEPSCVSIIADKIIFLNQGRIEWVGDIKTMGATNIPYLQFFSKLLPSN
jgi:phospholipid/cholesterol/gamma-HCH transport system ATP-binding protein